MGSRKKLVKRLHGLIDRLETLLPASKTGVDWSYRAYQWRDGCLQSVVQPHRCALDDLLCMEQQKTEVLRTA